MSDRELAGWLVAVSSDRPTMFYAVACDDPEGAVEVVRKRRGSRKETYVVVGRYLRELEAVRYLTPGTATPL